MQFIKDIKFDFQGKVKERKDFVPFCYMENPCIQAHHKKAILAKADTLIGKTYPVLLASKYMAFIENGNRIDFENDYFERRNDFIVLVIAEHIERKGRYMQSIVNLIWMMLEETTWVVPAHYYIAGEYDKLPNAWMHENTPSSHLLEPIDLFSAETGAKLAFCYYLLKDELDSIDPCINVRILRELDKRIVNPIFDDAFRKNLFWTGENNPINNWCPWIISNIYTVCAFAVEDMELRERIVSLVTPWLDNFLCLYKDDGACSEGPIYWQFSSMTFFLCVELLYDLTDGKYNLLQHPFVKKMIEYIEKVHIEDFYYFNYADARPTFHINPAYLYQVGKSIQSSQLKNFAKRLAQLEYEHGNSIKTETGYLYNDISFTRETQNKIYEFYQTLCCGEVPFCVKGTKEKAACLSDLQLGCKMIDGLYLGVKGGHNDEAHNHCDVGEVIVYDHGNPVLVDIGKGEYTKRTFSNERYDLWNNSSDGHNTANINGMCQGVGEWHCATDFVFDEDNGEFSMQLKDAYPKEADIQSYVRSGKIIKGKIVVEDAICLNKKGKVDLHYMFVRKPIFYDNTVQVGNVCITFDPRFSATIDKMDCSEPEYGAILEAWNTNAVYRLTLHIENVHDETFTLTIEKNKKC